MNYVYGQFTLGGGAVEYNFPLMVGGLDESQY
jgi:hypothetical protein